MRSFILAALLSGAISSAQAAPPGYRAPRHFFTANHQAYRRLPVRLALGLNTAYYNGDITSSFKDNDFQAGFSIGLVHTLSPHLTFALDATYFRLKAVDHTPSRGFNFQSSNYMLTPLLRYNLFSDKSLYLGMNYRPQPFQVFLEAGVGALFYDPIARGGNGTDVGNLPPEVQGGYPGLAGVLPVGAGITLRASRSLFFTLEGLYHFTSTDLLDDINQRGNPDSLDSFATVALKLEYGFNKKVGKPLIRNN